MGFGQHIGILSRHIVGILDAGMQAVAWRFCDMGLGLRILCSTTVVATQRMPLQPIVTRSMLLIRSLRSKSRAWVRFLLVALLLSSMPTPTPAVASLTDATIAAAVTDWASTPTTATATYGPISAWDTSAVTSMGDLFYNKPTFNDDISEWNVAAVSNMYRMFELGQAFNQPIGKWNTASVSSTAT